MLPAVLLFGSLVVMLDGILGGTLLGPAHARPQAGATDTVRVRGKPITIPEIIERCVRGEKTKLGGHQDMTCTVTVRALAYWKEKKEIREVVFRKYTDATGFNRVIQLGESRHRYKLHDGNWIPATTDDDDVARVRVETGGYSDFAEIPFFLEEQQEFDFSLLERTVELDHVIFKIGFTPRSDFKPLPSGTVYVDTDNYRIIHEEFAFEHNPFPLLLKRIRKISRHWEELPGGEWVFTRILMEADLRGGWFGLVPDRFAVAVFRDDFRFDQGYDERIFGKR